jgi:hypothetical protein
MAYPMQRRLQRNIPTPLSARHGRRAAPSATTIFACPPRVPVVTMLGPGPATLVTPRTAPPGEAPPSHYSLASAAMLC